MGNGNTVRTENLKGKSPIAHGGHVGVEGEAVEAVDAEIVQGPLHLAGRHQAEGRGLRLEPAAGMGLEADDAQRQAALFGDRAGGVDDGLMPPVDAVKGADGAGGPGVEWGKVAPGLDDGQGHGSPLRDADAGGRGQSPRRP